MIKGAIFDVDGTLLDTMPLWRASAGKYLETLGIDADPAQNRRFFTLTVAESAELLRSEYGLKQSIEQISDGIRRAVVAGYREDAPLKPGAGEFLKSLAERDVPMSIVSSGSVHLIRAAFERLGIDQYFSSYFTAAETGLHKREPTMVLAAADSIGVTPKDAWVFEDALYAVNVAKAVGFHTVGIADALSVDEAGDLAAATEAFWHEYPSTIPDIML
ncbi:MAG: HAD family phosphatase [Actinomycetaceae bacterium]|nr:HAD family phosphatase [Arcanobacterium sp.]MDD7504584.1 HAD family phosphatase [Actinomycetaceae bacterium]